MPARCSSTFPDPSSYTSIWDLCTAEIIWYQTLHKWLTTSCTHHNFQYITFLLHYAAGVKSSMSNHAPSHSSPQNADHRAMWNKGHVCRKATKLIEDFNVSPQSQFQCIYVQWVHCDPPLTYRPLPEDVSNMMSFRFHYRLAKHLLSPLETRVSSCSILYW